MATSVPLTMYKFWCKGGVYGLIGRITLRSLQFIFAIMVAGLYGVGLHHATTIQAHAQPEWVYAEVVSCLSGVTCIIHCFVAVRRAGWFVWDGVLFVLWLAQVGIFVTIYASGVKPGYIEATQSLIRMRIALWVNLVNTLLWFATTVLGLVWCIRRCKVARQIDDKLAKGEGASVGIYDIEGCSYERSQHKVFEDAVNDNGNGSGNKEGSKDEEGVK